MSVTATSVDFGPFSRLIEFIMELDKLKSVQRKTRLLNNQRQENSAEHSWHFAMAAMGFSPYVHDVDINRVIQMALLHDVVEIDAGDVMVYDLAAREAIHEEEIKAANRIFGLLPEVQQQNFMSLWQEYESGETRESQIANMLDRVMPILMNLHNEGQSWKENGIRLEQVVERNKFIADVYPEFWQYLLPQLENAKHKGWIN